MKTIKTIKLKNEVKTKVKTKTDARELRIELIDALYDILNETPGCDAGRPAEESLRILSKNDWEKHLWGLETSFLRAATAAMDAPGLDEGAKTRIGAAARRLVRFRHKPAADD